MYRRWLIPFASMLLLWWLVTEFNHYLGAHGIYLYVGGLLVTYAALRLSLRHGLSATILLGLAIDAVEPVPVIGGHAVYGLHLMLLTTVHVILFQLRSRFPREEMPFGVMMAAIANFVLYLAVSLAFLGHQALPGAAWWRLSVDLLWSEIFVVGIAPWYFALQERALELGRVDLADEHRRSL